MRTLFILLFFLTVNFIHAQSKDELLLQMSSEDTTALHALVLYPEDVRTAIYEASAYPEVIIKAHSLQKNTSESFNSLISEFSREEQEELWDLARYPGLIRKLTEGGRKSNRNIKDILQDYPAEIHETAQNYGRNYYATLEKMNQLNTQADRTFNEILSSYPQSVQNAYHELIQYPEVLTILNDNMKMTVIVGDLYRTNPEFVKQHMDSLSLEIARRNAQELEDYKNGLKENPEAMREMESAAKEYAIEQGYSEDELNVRHETIVTNYVSYPYPFWYGYPSWFHRPYWYPYPYWYDWGFYYGPGGISFIGMPSWYFVNWYYNFYPHYYNYPYYTDFCVAHYYGHRNSTTSLTRGTREWVQENRSVVGEDYFREPLGRVERIRQLGKLDKEYQEFRNANPDTKLTRNEFLVTRQEDYPAINVTPERAKRIMQDQREVTPRDIPERPRVTPEQPHRRPPVKFPTDPPRRTTPRTQPAAPPRTQPRTVPPRTQPQHNPTPPPRHNPTPPPRQQMPRRNVPRTGMQLYDNYPQLNEAVHYHMVNWGK